MSLDAWLAQAFESLWRRYWPEACQRWLCAHGEHNGLGHFRAQFPGYRCYTICFTCGKVWDHAENTTTGADRCPNVA
jgi:hypothetical protein